MRRSHRLSLRKKDGKYEVYRKFGDDTEELVYKGELPCAIAVFNTQYGVFWCEEITEKEQFRFEYIWSVSIKLESSFKYNVNYFNLCLD